jgi:TonB family protein
VELLPAPRLIAPLLEAKFSNPSQRSINFEWSAVPKAIGYGIEIDCYGCWEKKRWSADHNHATNIYWMFQTNQYSFRFPSSADAGSWRVWSIDSAGRLGQASPWSVFAMEGKHGKNLPSPPAKTEMPGLPSSIVNNAHPVDSASGEPCVRPDPSTSTTAPKPVFTPDPGYGNTASRRFRVNGDVLAMLDINADGTVKRACLLRAVQADLGAEAIKVMRTWRFEPARRNGEPVPFEMSVATSFQIYPWRWN